MCILKTHLPRLKEKVTYHTMSVHIKEAITHVMMVVEVPWRMSPSKNVRDWVKVQSKSRYQQ